MPYFSFKLDLFHEGSACELVEFNRDDVDTKWLGSKLNRIYLNGMEDVINNYSNFQL